MIASDSTFLQIFPERKPDRIEVGLITLKPDANPEKVRMSLELHDDFLNQDINAKAIAILSTVGLADRVYYYPEKLSGGQKQRVAIARALVSHPKIVLADELTAALDKKSGRDVAEIMQKLAKEQGCTILLVTHDHRILDIADRIIYMEDGQLKTDGTDTATTGK